MIIIIKAVVVVEFLIVGEIRWAISSFFLFNAEYYSSSDESNITGLRLLCLKRPLLLLCQTLHNSKLLLQLDRRNLIRKKFE